MKPYNVGDLVYERGGLTIVCHFCQGNALRVLKSNSWYTWVKFNCKQSDEVLTIKTVRLVGVN